MYDAIVVGARCAGSTTAMLLARQGHRVLLVDRATFPSDTVSTHNILYRGLVKLHEWGLYERIVATGCPEFSKRTRDDGDFPLTGYIPRSKEGLAYAMCPRRIILDKILVDAAVGDAGHHRDPAGAHGISDAVGAAALLAEDLHNGLTGEKPMARALASYEERRNEAAFPLYEQNCRLAAFTPPSAEDLRIRVALRSASQDDINTYFDARYGTLSRETFFNPENLDRLFHNAAERDIEADHHR